jgi:hypothetical protein
MAFWAWSSDEIRSAYSLSEQGEFLVIAPGAPNTYSSILAKDKKTVVLAPGTNLSALKTHAKQVEKNLQ